MKKGQKVTWSLRQILYVGDRISILVTFFVFGALNDQNRCYHFYRDLNQIIWCRRRRIRTVKVRTTLSRPAGQNPDSRQNEDRKNPDRQSSDSIFYKILDIIQSTDRHRTGFSGKSGKTRQGQDTDRAVRRRLIWWRCWSLIRDHRTSRSAFHWNGSIFTF